MAATSGSTGQPTRRLLALARDLLQTSELRPVLELVGSALQELLGADETLLLVTIGEREEYVTAFDRRGFLMPADRTGPLYRNAREALQAGSQRVQTAQLAAGGAVSADGEAAGEAGILALPFPPLEPIGVLAILWARNGSAEQMGLHVPVLRYLSELVGAALGNVGARLVLEAQLAARSEGSASPAQASGGAAPAPHPFEQGGIPRIAFTDILTGMLNRRGFVEFATPALEAAHRQGHDAVLVIADIDGLKAVNEQFGLDVGDELIQRCARILRQVFGSQDILARLGGDEFAILVRDPAVPETLLARLQDELELERRQASLPYRVSISTSVVTCAVSSGTTLTDCLAMAREPLSAPDGSRLN